MQGRKPILRGGVVLKLQGLDLDLHLQDLAVQLVQLFGFAVHLHAQTAGGFVHQVDRLVRQETVGDIAVAQRRGRHKGAVADPHTVVEFVFLLDAAQDADRVFDGGFFDQHRLEPTGKCRVFFNVFSVFIQCGRTDAMQFAACEGGLDQVGRIHCAISLARANQRVHFVDKQDDFARRGFNFLENSLEPLFKLTAVFRPGDQCAHVQRQQPFVAQGFRHVTINDAQGQPFGDGGFTDTGFPDQNRVILGAARQNLHRPADFVIASDDRVNFAFCGGGGQIAGVFFQRFKRIFGGFAVGGATLADIVDRLVQLLGRQIARLKRLFGGAFHQSQRGQKPFDRHKAVFGLLRDFLRFGQNLDRLIVHICLTGIATDLWDFRQCDVQLLRNARRIATRLADQVAGQPFVVIHQCLKHVFGRQTLVAFPDRDCLRRLNETARPLRELG